MPTTLNTNVQLLTLAFVPPASSLLLAVLQKTPWKEGEEKKRKKKEKGSGVLAGVWPSAPSPSARMRLPISLSRTRLSDTVASITSWMGLLVEGVNTGFPHAREFHLQHFSEDVLLSNVAAIFWRVQLTSICLPVKAGCV